MKNLCRVYFTLATISLGLKGPIGALEEGEYKTWIPNTNWNNGANWASGKIPCPLNNVQLGVPLSNAPLAVGLTGYNSLQSLTLPSSGELIFYKDAGLNFFQEKDKDIVLEKCTEKGGIQFVASVPKMWYNPNNWQVTDVDGKPVSNPANAVLQMEKVPCQHDQVLFPKESSFNVGSTKPIVVASVTINAKQYSQSSLKDFLNSESGAMQFKLSKVPVQLTGETCNDAKGCLCNTTEQRTTICNHVICVQPQCSDPLKPIGSCCTYCGVLVKVKPGASFTLSGFKTKIMNLVAKLAHGTRSTLVQVSISTIGDNTIQVVFTDSANGQHAQRLAEQITDQISGSSDFTIIKISKSGLASRSEDEKDDFSSLRLYLGFGISLPLVVFIVIAVFLWRRKKSSPQRLMEEDPNGTELQEMPVNTVEEGDKDNPSESTKYQNLESDNLLYEAGGVKTTFTNPLYESTTGENLEPVI